MNSLISLSPFVVLIYAVFALVQAIRHQRQSFRAALLALVVVAVPFIAYLTSNDAAVRLSMMGTMALSAIILFLTSIVVMFIERRDRAQNKGRSYSILGIAMSVALVVGFLGITMNQAIPSSFGGFSGASDNGTLLNVSAPGGSSTTTNQGTPTKADGSSVAQVISTQTGLSGDELITKVKAGSTIAQLVEAHKGDLNAVNKAIAAVFDGLKAQGGMPAQMIGSLGSDSMDIAMKLINGQLPSQVQQMITTQMISGNGAPPQGSPNLAGSGQFAPPGNANGAQVAAVPTGTPQSGTGGFVAAQSAEPSNSNQAQLTSPTATDVPATLAPTEVVVRPTQMVFPTVDIAATPIAESTNESTTAQTVVANSAITCTLVVDYNLNLRDKPSQEGSTVFLSIPFGTTVTTVGHTSDNWYKVTYDTKTGWVSGEYVTQQASCSQLQTVSGE